MKFCSFGKIGALNENLVTWLKFPLPLRLHTNEWTTMHYSASSSPFAPFISSRNGIFGNGSRANQGRILALSAALDVSFRFKPCQRGIDYVLGSPLVPPPTRYFCWVQFENFSEHYYKIVQCMRKNFGPTFQKFDGL